MKCQECSKQGMKSFVYPGTSTTTLIYCPLHYDEEGKLHNHDLNTTNSSFRCSRGHVWWEKIKKSCWCGWPNRENEA